ncbi:MAG: septum formation protein Maf [Spirochaetales bacterium]|jgi:septum formation protein|nr:septum formation protein Maf [Spirochaetales bacterium]
MLILASSSPQRKALLKQIGIDPIVVPSEIPEEVEGNNVRGDITLLAKQKLEAVLSSLLTSPEIAGELKEPCWIIAADTVVVCKEEVFGKPEDESDAKRMLSSLSGTRHSVLTAVHISRLCRSSENLVEDSRAEIAETYVDFISMNPADITWYLFTEEWRGAAGGYRIQARGAVLVEAISGSFSNVVGLPLELIYGMLGDLGFLF